MTEETFNAAIAEISVRIQSLIQPPSPDQPLLRRKNPVTRLCNDHDMTHQARITQADIGRALKALRSAGIENARVVLDYANQRIEIIVGEASAALADAEEWSDDDF